MRNLSKIVNITLLMLIVAALSTGARAQEQVIFPFYLYNYGAVPLFAAPVTDSAGNLYAVSNFTYGGQASALIIQLSPPTTKNGEWTASAPASPSGSMNSGLLADSAGNLYGTATGGTLGYGYAFKFSVASSQLSVLANLPLSALAPTSSLVMDSAGNLYGASYGNSTYNGCGAVFQIQPPASGQTAWTENTIYSFPTSNTNCSPTGVVMDQHGNLFGMALSAFSSNPGIVFELIPPISGTGSWTEQTIYTFPSGDGAKVKASHRSPPKGYGGITVNTLAIDAAGNLYGTTPSGGASGNGSIFELSPPSSSGGSWAYATLYSFAGIPDGALPSGNLTVGKDGTILGTTLLGGPVTAWGGGGTGLGTLFELSPPKKSGGNWIETILHTFVGGYDGSFPITAPIFGPLGFLYGTTASGGYNNVGCAPIYPQGYATGCGVVYQIAP
jgi:uncharacterized repeat protein (TIGR03803 family)